MRTRTRNNFKSALAVVLVVVLAVSAAAGLTALLGKDTVNIGARSFTVGGLDANGTFIDAKTSIVSDYFEFDGLTIDPAINATGSYQVF